MSVYSVAEAKARLSALIDEALEGGRVVITRHGQPVVEIKGVTEKRQPRRMTQADFDWLAERRKKRKVKGGVSPVEFFLKLRDEDGL
jgi:prevent-host-death family protein